MKNNRIINLSILYIINLILCIILVFSINFENKISVYADNGFNVEQISTSSEFLSTTYIDHYAYSVDSSKDEYIKAFSNNGNNWGSNVLKNAFDQNFNTFWETNIVNSNTFKNYVTIEFNAEVQIDRLIYATRRDSDKQKGFPLTATFYVSNDGISFNKIASVDADLTDNILLYTFDKIYTTKYIRFEYTQVNANKTQHASASEFLFLKPEEDEVINARNLFVDYKKSEVNPLYTTIEDVVALENSVKGYPIYELMKDDFVRARKVLNREIIFDEEHREFSTNPQNNTKHLKQVGNIVNYARNTLKMTWQGTNRQVTGINVKANETIKIYVEAEEGDPLPSVIFTQHLGHWSKWLSGTYTLSRGENILTAPNLYDSSWSVQTLAGGPIYLVNPYTSEQQSANVKVYIEGGDIFPVFYQGGDEQEYKEELTEYYNSYESATVQNITEIVSNNVILTVQATRAYYYYIQNNLSVQQVCDNWDEYLKGLYAFDGVSYDINNEHYNKLANYLNVNVRIMQPYAAAYAYTEHIGIQIGNWQDVSLQGSSWGWGMTHEIGHMMDISERVVSETSNNMISNFNKCANEGTGSRENHSVITQLMAPDDVDPSQVWTNYQGSCAIWWNIESLFHGYWGALDNLYRYGPSVSGMTKAEKQVYYSSVVLGIDMSYYFERYGYAFGGTMFVENTASEAFKNAMNELHTNGTIVDNALKFWYLDAMEYNYVMQYGDTLNIYNENIKFNIVSIKNTSNGYSLVLPTPSNAIAHLGYEILEGNEYDGYKVIGFTNGSIYVDNRTYEDGYIPNYKIRAYDRTLSATTLSDNYVDEQQIVCVLNEQNYSSLTEALADAQEGDTIFLVQNINESNLIIDKNITLTLLDNSKDITINRIDSEDIFIVKEGVTFNLIGTADSKIIFEGYSTSLNGRIIFSSGIINFNNVVIQNVFTSRSSPIFIQSGQININNSKFYNNKSTNGGVITTQGGCILDVKNSVFEDNTATSNGGVFNINGRNNIENSQFIKNNAGYGGVIILNGGSITFSDCTMSQNNASTMGGIGFIYGNAIFNKSTFTLNTSSRGAIHYMQGYGVSIFNDCVIYNNSASIEGGGVYCNQYGSTLFNNTDLYNNSAPKGSALYLNNGNGRYNIGTGRLQGEIFLNNSPVLSLNGEINDSINIIINTSKTIGATVINNNTFFGIEDLEKIKLENTLAEKCVLALSNEDKSIILEEKTYDLYLILGNDKKYLGTYSYGESYLLPSDINVPNGFKLLGFDYAEDTYKIGDSITIKANELYAKLGTLNSLTANVNGKTQVLSTQYVNGEIINLNEIVVENGYKIVGYIYENNLYSVDEQIEYNENYSTIDILVRKAYVINLHYGNNVELLSGQYIEGDYIDLSQIQIPEYFKVSNWIYDNNSYEIQDSIQMVEGVSDIYAEGESAYKIVFKIGDTTYISQDYYWQDETFIIPNYSAPFGQSIESWQYNGVTYNAGDEVVFDGINYIVEANTYTDWGKIIALIIGCIFIIIIIALVTYIIVKKLY